MKKSDLQNMMLVKLKNADHMIVVDSHLVGSTHGYSLLEYNDDLTHISDLSKDIIEVYERMNNLNTIYSNKMELMWSRKEKKFNYYSSQFTNKLLDLLEPLLQSYGDYYFIKRGGYCCLYKSNDFNSRERIYLGIVYDLVTLNMEEDKFYQLKTIFEILR